MLFQDFLKKKFKEILNSLIKKKVLESTNFGIDNFSIEISQKNEFGDVSSNIAMVLSRVFKKSPLELGNFLKNELEEINTIKKVEIVKPGFINIFFENFFWQNQLKYLLKVVNSYDYKIKKKKICVEFVSANPTGLMHIGHARGAVLGDTISSLLEELGHKVTREYYINDAGEQIKKLVKTVKFHLANIKNNRNDELSIDLYPGIYLLEISKLIAKKIKTSTNIELEKIREKSLNLILNDIKKDLKDIRINHKTFISERKTSSQENVDDLKKKLLKKKLAYFGFQDKPQNVKNKEWVKEEQFLFKSKNFGDDSDRALLKPNGELTYFLSDIIYHQTKINRGFDILINIWGVDHFGYVKRLKNALKAINEKKNYDLEIKLTSLVNLLQENKVLKMSKRSGNYVTLREVVKKVGVDALRFMMISRSAEKKIDFDLQLVLLKTKDNPVFYIQYAYARCNSIMRISKGIFKKNMDFLSTNLSTLNLDSEKLLIRYLCNFNNIVLSSAINYEPHRLANYLYELAKIFHTYWGLGKQNKQNRIIIEDDQNISFSRLTLVFSVSLILKKGLKILKIDCPESM